MLKEKEQELIEFTVKAIREYDAKQQRSRHDRRLRNTRLLLKNYLLLQEHCKEAIYEKQKPDVSENAIDVFDVIESYDRDSYVRAIKGSVTRTKIILAHIDNMMQIYNVLCYQSSRPEDQRRYRVAYATYFENVNILTICKKEAIDKSTYYRDIREAVETLSALFFGIDGLLDMRKG